MRGNSKPSGRAWHGSRPALQKTRVVTAPHGSKRWRVVRLTIRGALIWRRDGFTTFVGKGSRKAVAIAGKIVRPRPSLQSPAPLLAIEAQIVAPGSHRHRATTYHIPPETPIYQAWLANNRWNEQAQAMAELALRTLPRRPRFSIVMPVYNIEDCWLEKAVASVQNQVYPNWELCIADDASTAPNVRRSSTVSPRPTLGIKVRYLEKNGNISVASNAAAGLAKGEYLVLLDQDDELTPDCLLELANAIGRHPHPDIVYSDDDKVDENGQRFAPQFKPGWSPELLLSYMYFSHVFCFRRDLFEEVGGFREGFRRVPGLRPGPAT